MRVLLLSFFILIVNLSIAQRTITGTVTDQSGAALEGVTVAVRATDNKTVTDISGKFTIKIPVVTNFLEFSKEKCKTEVVEITKLLNRSLFSASYTGAFAVIVLHSSIG